MRKTHWNFLFFSPSTALCWQKKRRVKSWPQCCPILSNSGFRPSLHQQRRHLIGVLRGHNPLRNALAFLLSFFFCFPLLLLVAADLPETGPGRPIYTDGCEGGGFPKTQTRLLHARAPPPIDKCVFSSLHVHFWDFFCPGCNTWLGRKRSDAN